ncbi:MAG: aminodeoxychorismate synthase component I [Clostridia bacterium]|nr:aminodeoxychorismate synthase component I [Clostridia bacterium]
MIIRTYETHLNSNDIFKQLSQQKHVMFLDSSKIDANLGKYSIIVCNPRHVLQCKGDKITLDGEKLEVSDPFVGLQHILDQYQQNYNSDLPFIGGCVGFLSYDLKAFVEDLPVSTTDDMDMPDMFFGVYDGGVVINHDTKEVFITDAAIDNFGEKRIEKLIEIIEKPLVEVYLKGHETAAEVVSNFNKQDYITAIEKVRNYIRSGDIYQVNMTQRFEAPLRDEPVELYEKLRMTNPAPFSSYIDYGTGHICSSSPERFISVRDRKIETRPIKGTMPRSKDPEIDQRNKDQLIHSEKDQSELLMIVDLERNDLSRIAKTGSVKVTELFKLETYETVFHLVATIQAEIDEPYSIADVLKATFPGGSITGAPKIRAMEVIDELEPTSRGLYTGSIGYIDFNQNLDLNIVIRTFILENEKAYFQAGGGIVWDSDPELEYEESLAKAYALKKTLNYGVKDA